MKPRDRRALMVLGIAVALYLLLQYLLPTPGEQATAPAAFTADSITNAERRLQRLRQTASTVPGKEEALKRAASELREREKLLIDAPTAQQAQAHLLEILRNVARAQQPPLELRNVELGQLRAYGDDYGEVRASAAVDCRIEDLVNLLSDLTAQKEMVALSELRINSSSNKQKTVSVKLTVSGLVAKKLLPEKKGLASF